MICIRSQFYHVAGIGSSFPHKILPPIVQTLSNSELHSFTDFPRLHFDITTCKCNTVLKWFDASKKESIAKALKQEVLLYEVMVPIDQRVSPPFSFFRVENQAHLPSIKSEAKIFNWWATRSPPSTLHWPATILNISRVSPPKLNRSEHPCPFWLLVGVHATYPVTGRWWTIVWRQFLLLVN